MSYFRWLLAVVFLIAVTAEYCPDVNYCPDGWMLCEYTKKCFKKVIGRHTHAEAVQICKDNHNSTLAVFADKDSYESDNAIIADWFNTGFFLNITEQVWIGYTKNAAGQWVTPQGALMDFSDWAPGAPGSWGNCTLIYTYWPFDHTYWNDYDCNQTLRGLVCEINALH